MEAASSLSERLQGELLKAFQSAIIACIPFKDVSQSQNKHTDLVNIPCLRRSLRLKKKQDNSNSQNREKLKRETEALYEIYCNPFRREIQCNVRKIFACELKKKKASRAINIDTTQIQDLDKQIIKYRNIIRHNRYFLMDFERRRRLMFRALGL